MIIGEIMMSINIIMNINITSICISWGTISSVVGTPKVFLRVQEEQGAFTVRFLMRT